MKGKQNMSNTLAEEFNIENVRTEIKTFKDILRDIKEIPNPSLIVTAALEKATMFIDMIHTEAVNGEMSPRYMEVAAALINTVIQSSGFLLSVDQAGFDNRLKTISSKQKDREIDIKRKELEIKEIYYNTKHIGEGGSKNSIIVTDYNSILKFLDDKKEIA